VRAFDEANTHSNDQAMEQGKSAGADLIVGTSVIALQAKVPLSMNKKRVNAGVEDIGRDLTVARYGI